MTRASSHGRPLRDVPHPAGTDPAAGGGKAPAGMWWVAWRQHRAQLAISLGLLVALALAWVVFRLALVSRLAELTGGDDSRCTSIEPSSGLSSDYCPEQVYGAVQAEFGTLWGLLRLGMLALPLVLGAFVGAPLFAREFEQHTQVYVLTQSISRMRWWATKVTVVAVPVVLGMIGVGLLMEWASAPFAAYSYGSMNTPEFETRGIIPAVFTALTIALGVCAGIVLRSTVNALAVTIVVAGMLVVVLGLVRPHLLTPDRIVNPVALSDSGTDGFHPDARSWFLDSGYLDAGGTPVDFSGSCPALDAGPVSTTDDQVNHTRSDCMRDQGIVSEYIDYLPAERRTALQLAVTGICAALTALILAAGVVVLRRRVL